MGNRFEGKIVLITGGGGGLGSAECKMFASEGAQAVIIGDIVSKEMHKTILEMKKLSSSEIIPIDLDVTSEEHWKHVVELIDKKFGKLDVLVNNAGINKRVPIEECSLEDWNRVMAVNATGTFLGIKYCAPLLKKSGNASIVNTASVAGMTGHFTSPYTASKWAVRGITKIAAMEFSTSGIRVNSVNPGFVWTPLTMGAKDMMDASEKVIPMERAAQPEEIAKAVMFLASDDSSYMTGSDLVIDGGLTSGSEFRLIAKEIGVYK